jgi:hypothetical protein
MRGPSRTIAAALYRHPAGTELVVSFEPDDAEDVLETRFERFDVGQLEARADEMRGLLEAKGWTPLKKDPAKDA